MHVLLNSIAFAALLSSIPFASVVRSYPTGGYINVVDTSKRGFPKPTSPNPFRDPSTSPPLSNPFRDPSTSPSLPGSPVSAASTWRTFANGDLKLENAAQDAMRAKGQGLMQDLEAAITHQSASKKPQSMEANGYKGQGGLLEPPKLKIHQNFNPYQEFQIEISSNWHGQDIKKAGSDTIVKTYEDTAQKAMIISKSSNKEQDAGGKLTWSDMVVSNWHETSIRTTKPVSDLKYIIRNNIQPISTKTSDGITLDTISAMKGAFDAMRKSTQETLILDFKTTEKVELQQVSILSAQTHVARVLQMLKDYRGEFKDLTITKLHLQDYNHVRTDFQYNIIIELGK